MERRESILKIISCFPTMVGHALERMTDYRNIHEIRMRSCRPVGIVSFGRERFLTDNGGLSDFPDMCTRLTQDDIEYSFRAVCDYSIHSFRREIAEGFVTLEGGNRVGICGTAVNEGGQVSTLKYISGLNFRIAGQATGCAEEICRTFKGNIYSTLIIGPPMSGKTTIIRDMCRILGKKHRISVIDERGEIGAVYHGVHQNDVGEFTDVFDGYPKAEGIMTAVRVMSPDIVVCDEIGGEADCKALLSSANTGVRIIASVHGRDHEGLKKRSYINEIIERGIFDCFVILKGGADTGRISSLFFEKGNLQC